MKTKDITPEMFKEITFLHRDVPGLSAHKYRVYSDHGHYTLVEAESALEAVNKSDIKNPVRVLRDTIYLENVLVLDAADLTKTTEKNESSVVQPVSDEPSVSAENTSATLSNDDVDKLLNS